MVIAWADHHPSLNIKIVLSYDHCVFSWTLRKTAYPVSWRASASPARARWRWGGSRGACTWPRSPTAGRSRCSPGPGRRWTSGTRVRWRPTASAGWNRAAKARPLKIDHQESGGGDAPFPSRGFWSSRMRSRCRVHPARRSGRFSVSSGPSPSLAARSSRDDWNAARGWWMFISWLSCWAKAFGEVAFLLVCSFGCLALISFIGSRKLLQGRFRNAHVLWERLSETRGV